MKGNQSKLETDLDFLVIKENAVESRSTFDTHSHDLWNVHLLALHHNAQGGFTHGGGNALMCLGETVGQ